MPSIQVEETKAPVEEAPAPAPAAAAEPEAKAEEPEAKKEEEPEAKKEEEAEPKKKDDEESQEKPPENKPKFTKHIKSQNLMEGDPLTLECNCSGTFARSRTTLALRRLLAVGGDDMEINWLRNNKEIPENPDFRRERDGDTFKLVVTEV